MIDHGARLLVDAREFVTGRFTGIGRVLEGLIDALFESGFPGGIRLALEQRDAVPPKLKGRSEIQIEKIRGGFVRQEMILSSLCKKGCDLFISPYRKLPLPACPCKTIHTIHDVLDLTPSVYKKRFKAMLDIMRLKLALRKADLTWYDSSWSMAETKRLVGFAGKNPKVRYLGIDERFRKGSAHDCTQVLETYDLAPDYILVLGNGLPHKNLGVLLGISDTLPKTLVFVGVSERNQAYWKSRYPGARARWISYVRGEELPAIIRGAFCLAQPSTAEGYGYPPLEAMACGIPAVVSRISVLMETTGGNALNASPDNPKEWLEAFQALESGDLYNGHVEKGLKWVEPFRGRQGWEKQVSDIIALTKED